MKGAVSHHDAEIAELRADPELAAAYLRTALESLGDPGERPGALLALRAVAEAHGGLRAALSPNGDDEEILAGLGISRLFSR